MKTLLATTFLLLLSLSAQSAVKITDYGAIPNDNVSDATAIQAALRQVEQDCGGELIIPKGEFLLDKTVATDFYGGCGYIHLTIRGETGAELRISVGAGNTALQLATLKSLQMSNIVFLGVNAPPNSPAFTDAGTIIVVHTVENVKLDHLFFYGVAVNNAIIRTMNSNFRISDSQFAGSAAYYSDGGAYILGDNDGFGNGWQSILVDNCQFLDYANYKFNYISKTPYALTGSYIRTKAPTKGGAALGRGKLEVRDSMFDEGSYTAINAADTPFVSIKGISINLNITGGASGIRLTNVGYVTIEQSVADWGRSAYFLTTQGVEYVKVSSLNFKSGTKFHRDLGRTNLVIEYCPECATDESSVTSPKSKK